MRDVDIEARLRSALRADAETLPFSITHAELERRSALRRRARDSRRLSLVAAGVAALAVGALVVLASGWVRTPPVGESSPAAVIPPSSHEPSFAPAPSATADAPEGTDGVAPACEQIDPALLQVPPDVLATLSPHEISFRTGLLDSFILGTFGSVDPSRWRVPDPDGWSLVPARPNARLRFAIGGPYACVTRLTVDATRLDPSGALPLDATGQPTGGSSRLADLGQVGNRQLLVDIPPGPGRWVVRAFATFATTSGTAQSVSFFLVDTLAPGASAPVPTASPSSLADLPPPAGTVFVDRDATNSGPGGPIPIFDNQPDPGQMYDLGELPQRPTYTLATACLGDRPVFWSIGERYASGMLTSHDVRCDGASHTVDVSLGTPTTPLHLFVGVLDASDGSQAGQASRWHIQASSDDPAPEFVPPALDARIASTAPANAATSYLQCLELDGVGATCPDTYETQDAAPFVTMTAGDDLDLALPADWTIERIVIDAVPSILVYTDPSPAGVRPAVFSGTPHASDVRVALGGILVPGQWTVRVHVTATGDGHTISGWYDVPVHIES
jgi:hypothetical protein